MFGCTWNAPTYHVFLASRRNHLGLSLNCSESSEWVVSGWFPFQAASVDFGSGFPFNNPNQFSIRKAQGLDILEPPKWPAFRGEQASLRVQFLPHTKREALKHLPVGALQFQPVQLGKAEQEHSWGCRIAIYLLPAFFQSVWVCRFAGARHTQPTGKLPGRSRISANLPPFGRIYQLPRVSLESL